MSRAHHSLARRSAGDRVFTPHWAASDMVTHFGPQGRVLEAAKGAGAILDLLPPGAMWCEIDEGRDFFEWQEPVDWIITNPPYDQTRAFLKHALTLAEHVVFLVPARNIFSGYGTVREAVPGSRLAAIRWYGTGSRLGFPMGNAIAAFHWRRGHNGGIAETFYEDDLPTPPPTNTPTSRVASSPQTADPEPGMNQNLSGDQP